MNKPSVSVIILTLNAEKFINKLLSSLKDQTVQGELIVIDSSSEDNTIGIAESFGVRTMKVSRNDFDHGRTRNLAIQSTRGNILVFLTQDALPANERSVENLLKGFSDEKVGACYGRQLPYPDASPFAAHLRVFKYPALSYTRTLDDKKHYGIETPFLSNSFSAYRRGALEKIGNFKDGILFAEDVYAGAKLLLAGYKIAYTADALVFHSHNHSMFDEMKRYFDTGVFYKTEEWIGREFGKNLQEGMRYIVSEFFYLLNKRCFLLIPQFIIRNLLRYLGYSLGKNYEKLSTDIVKKISMNSKWWDGLKVK